MKATYRRAVLIGLLMSLACPLVMADRQEDVTVFHWWVSDGEHASIEVIQRYIEARGIHWRDRAIAGSGTARFGDVLKAAVEAGEPPMASQVIGYDIHYWASRGELVNLDDIAREQEWDEVVPYGIQSLSKYDGHWYAAPINTHSTNWLWFNGNLFRRLGGVAPDTWEDLLSMLEEARKMDIVPLAIGQEAWEHTLLFEAVAAGAGGAEFYRKAFLELDPTALDEELLLTIFRRMSQLREYLDEDFSGRTWNEATQLVLSGDALLQVQGSWVDGEFSYHGYIPGQDYACFRFPDTQGMFLFNSDQYMLFKDGPGNDETRREFVHTLMSIDLQRDVNISSGAAPARVDVPRDDFNLCGRQAISNMRSTNMRRTLMGSIAMGNANPPEVKTSIYRVISDHLYGRIDDEEAVYRLRETIMKHSAGS
ncbi:hypothetical protein L861_01380 [Litchfieldella anticariensis FP35 = DSM 16096]|uniref:Probable sugar-binding periplasmic protein n=1 Tax=Litchfieldella anticariensis (strain DSM 16096 / CECT 5854 / CIP 108499 / LMG 22089 / FP35) TaxID=1121939 RepID=S2KPG7_LITA3|nr:ABC transporter substrate-binding protein [Halomonas anticariensis]EPC03982.1 hypothetical protein L861_01380 [Halomonas anticariensis FP35 = DSM 16096]